MRIGVITRVPEPNAMGNLATAMGMVFLDPQAKGGDIDDERIPLGRALGQPMLDIYVQVPVFKLGEILILDHNDRDQFGRKPGKWDVDCEEFDDIYKAVIRIRELTE